MIKGKSKKEIEKMQKGGEILAEVLREVLENARVGVSELELDNLAEKLILEKGGESAFKKVKGYKHAICISTNDVVVHGVPSQYRLKEGDVVGIDCGVYYQGFNTDMAQTVRIQSSSIRRAQDKKFKIQNLDEVDRFLETGKKALWEGIKQERIGNRVGHISKTIQRIVEEGRYNVVRSLVGHGVGRKLHEKPEVPGFLDVPINQTPFLQEGATIAVEVIYNWGGPDVVYANKDGWTIKTKDKSTSALFERTIAITCKGPVVLTK